MPADAPMPRRSGSAPSARRASTSAAGSRSSKRLSASASVMRPSRTRSTAILSAARGVRLAARVCKIHSRSSSISEFDVLHVTQLQFQPLQDFTQVPRHRRQGADEGRLGDRASVSRHDILALGVEQNVDHRLRAAGRGIARESGAGTRVRSAVAEHHGLNRDGGALQMLELLQPPIGAGTLARPGAENTDARRRAIAPSDRRARLVAFVDEGLVGGRGALSASLSSSRSLRRLRWRPGRRGAR